MDSSSELVTVSFDLCGLAEQLEEIKSKIIEVAACLDGLNKTLDCYRNTFDNIVISDACACTDRCIIENGRWLYYCEDCGAVYIDGEKCYDSMQEYFEWRFKSKAIEPLALCKCGARPQITHDICQGYGVFCGCPECSMGVGHFGTEAEARQDWQRIMS